MKLSDYVMEFVANAGVKHVFMLTGGGCMHLTDSLGSNARLDYVCCLHEQACAFAAEAYAEFTDGLGVALVTTGPGGTNTVTGVAAAWIESAPCLFISGQAKRADLIGSSGVRSMGQQEVDIVSVVKPITKYAKTVLDPLTIRCELEKAVYLATHGRRGPVWLDIPLDVQAALIDEDSLVGWTPADDRRECPTEQILRAIELLNKAERPVLFLGNGARAAHAQGLVSRLIETLRIPVLVTWKIVDAVPDGNEFYAGRPGAIGQRGANFTQQNADCMLIIGARLDRPQTAFSYSNFGRAATKILVDIDPAEIAKFDMPIDVPVCADAADFIAGLLRHADRIAPKDRSCWARRAREWQQRYPVVLPEYWENVEDVVNTYVLMDVLSDELGPDDLIVPWQLRPVQRHFHAGIRIKPGQRVVNAPGLGAMGTGLPGAMGACLASGRKRTTCINGDGGFQLNIQELETVKRLDLPIRYFVLCNGGYACIMASQRNYFNGRFTGSDPSSRLTFPDIVRVAEAYGIPTMRIPNHGDIRNQVRAALAHPGPLICAVDVSANEALAPRVSSMVRPDGSIVSKPMEDMSPLLDRDEFVANMIIPPLEEA